MSKILACEQASATDIESETSVITEQELISLCQQGDRACFRYVVQHH